MHKEHEMQDGNRKQKRRGRKKRKKQAKGPRDGDGEGKVRKQENRREADQKNGESTLGDLIKTDFVKSVFRARN